MKLEDQVTSLRLSKKLKELGVKQLSLFCWCKGGTRNYVIREFEFKVFYEKWCSAFTVAELGEMIPAGMTLKTFYPETENAWVGFWDEKEKIDKIFYGNTEADARAKMLCYLLENKLIKGDKQ